MGNTEIKVIQEANRTTIRIVGRLDESGSDALKRCFFELDLKKNPDVVFDFQAVTYIGSAGIGKLLLFYKEMFEASGKIRIINTNPTVYTMLKTVKLDSIFSISKI